MTTTELAGILVNLITLVGVVAQLKITSAVQSSEILGLKDDHKNHKIDTLKLARLLEKQQDKLNQLALDVEKIKRS